MNKEIANKFSKLAINDVDKAEVLNEVINSLIDLLTMIEADDEAKSYYVDILNDTIDKLEKLDIITQSFEPLEDIVNDLISTEELELSIWYNRDLGEHTENAGWCIEVTLHKPLEVFQTEVHETLRGALKEAQQHILVKLVIGDEDH